MPYIADANITSGKSYKASMLINYDSIVRKYKQFTSNYESRGVIYKRKMFIRLATGVNSMGTPNHGAITSHNFIAFVFQQSQFSISCYCGLHAY